MASSSPSRPISISLLALPETTPTAIYGLVELFSAVAVAWSELTGQAPDPGARLMTPHIVARSSRPYASPLGIPIVPHAALEDVDGSDIVIVTDVALTTETDPRGRWKEEVRWARARHAEGATLCSVCTGSLFLAETGLLDGLEATTHWSAANVFRSYYPRVMLRPERMLCPAGAGHRIITGGGASAWADLALYLIARFCGEAEAVRIAKIFLLGDHSAGQLPYTAMGRPRQHGDAAIGACQSWIAQHYTAANPVARMVERSGLAERTFKRRFKAATGYAPVDYVQALRIEEAKQLLESTSEPTDAVAHAVGYEDPAFFRRLFKRRTGMTPARYRLMFQDIGRLREGA